MWNQHIRFIRNARAAAPAPAPDPAPDPAPVPPRPRLRPIEQLHPVLLHLIMRMDVMPPGDRASITEADLAHAVALAISMMPDDEQAYMVSRIMTDDEVAEERLRSPEMQDLGRRVVLSADERRLLLRAASPEPPEDDNDNDNDDEDNDNIDNPCIVCGGRSEATVPCGCHYCASCLRANIRTGLRSEMDFPPRCCRPFDEAVIRQAQRPALVHLFRQLAAEYAVPAEMRVYCHDASCASFIPPTAIRDAPDDEDDATPVGTCPSCGKETCAECGSRSHRGLPCSEEEVEEALWDMMDDQGLVQCPVCGIVVALRDGCNHMTCLCHAEFCYLCGLPWRRCACPLYGYFHLRVPVRERPGRRPVARGGRAHLAEGAEGVLRIPQLRYDPDDELALAAVEDDDAPLAPAAAAGWRDQPVFDSDSDSGDGAPAVAPPRHDAGRAQHRDHDRGRVQGPQQQHPPVAEPGARNGVRDGMNAFIRRAFDQLPAIYDPFRLFNDPGPHMQAGPAPVPAPPPPPPPAAAPVPRGHFEHHHRQYGHHHVGHQPPQHPPLDIQQALELLHIAEARQVQYIDRMRAELRMAHRGPLEHQHHHHHRPGPQPRAQLAPQQHHGDRHAAGDVARPRRRRERSNSRERRAYERERRRTRDDERRRQQMVGMFGDWSPEEERLRQRFERGGY